MDKQNTRDLIMYLCEKKGIEPTKIYFNDEIKEGIIIGPPDQIDAMWRIRPNGHIKIFTPMEDIDKYNKITKDGEVIYSTEKSK